MALRTLEVVCPMVWERARRRHVVRRQRRAVRVRDSRQREQRVRGQVEREAAVDQPHCARVREELCAIDRSPRTRRRAKRLGRRRAARTRRHQVEERAPHVQLLQCVLKAGEIRSTDSSCALSITRVSSQVS